MKEKIKKFILDLFFPKFCLSCKKEGAFLCEDCEALLKISSLHQRYQTENLSDLYFALEYKSPLIKKIIQLFKYQPFAKELSIVLSKLIINHFQLIENPPSFLRKKLDYIIIPIPLSKRKLRWRGFNQAEEIGIELSRILKIPIIKGVLTKEKDSLPQVELSEKGRRKNILGTFAYQNQKNLLGKKVLLVDDIYTTGSTMEEAAKTLIKAGAKEVIGIVVARAKVGEDKLEK